jgi:hypothetical protein
MSRIGHKIIGPFAIALAALALGPASSLAMYSSGAADPGDQVGARTDTELGQAVGEPTEPVAVGTASRTTTELAQRVESQPPLGEPAAGFDWGDAAIGAVTALALAAAAFGGFALLGRRRTITGSRLPAPSN